MKKLPKSWVVKNDLDNPNYKKIINYIIKVSGIVVGGSAYNYYGLDEKNIVYVDSNLSNYPVLSIEDVIKCIAPIKELPKYWVVAKPKDYETSEGWKRVLDYINLTYGVKWGGGVYNYYGYDGSDRNNGTNSWNDVKLFENSPTILSVEEFLSIIDNEEKEYSLPEKWCVEIDTSHPEIQKWFNENSQNGNKSYHTYTRGYLHFPSFYLASLGLHQNNIITDGYELISYEVFEKYVLAPSKKEDTIPEKWCINSEGHIKEVTDWFNEKSGQNYGRMGIPYYYHYPSHMDGFHSSTRVLEGYTEITFEQFKKHILKQDTMETSSKTQTISKENLGKIHAIACATWKTKLADKAKENPFSPIVVYTDEEVKEMFDASGPSQKTVLQQYFKEPKEDKNAFIKGAISSKELSEFSEKVFGDTLTLQRLMGATPLDKPELENRGFYVNNKYKVEVGPASSDGTYIAIYKK